MGEVFSLSRSREYRRAMDCYNRGDFEAALLGFEKTINSSGDKSVNASLARIFTGFCHRNLGLVCLFSGRDEEAADHFGLALRTGVADPAVSYHLAVVLNRLGRYGEAAARLEKAIGPNPRLKVAIAKAGLELNLGRNDAAERDFRRLVAAHPGFPDLRRNLALALVRTGQLEEAEAQLEKALGLNPDYDLARRDLESLKACQSKPDAEKANLEEMLSSKIELREDISLFFLQAEEKDDNGLAKALEKAMLRESTRQPHWADIQFHLGQVFCLTGRLDEARSRFEQALAMNPDYEEAAKALRALKTK